MKSKKHPTIREAAKKFASSVVRDLGKMTPQERKSRIEDADRFMRKFRERESSDPCEDSSASDIPSKGRFSQNTPGFPCGIQAASSKK